MNSYNLKDIVSLLQNKEISKELQEISSQIDLLYSKYNELARKETFNIEFTKQNGKKGLIFMSRYGVVTAKLYTDSGKLSDQYVNLDKLKIVSYKKINKNN